MEKKLEENNIKKTNLKESQKKQNEKQNGKQNNYASESNCNDLLSDAFIAFIGKGIEEIADNIGDIDSKRKTEIRENNNQFGSTSDSEKNKKEIINPKKKSKVKKPLTQNGNKRIEKTKDLNLNSIDNSKSIFQKYQSPKNIKVNHEEENYLDIENNNTSLENGIKILNVKKKIKKPIQGKKPSKINNINDNIGSITKSKGFICPLDKKEISLNGNESKNKKDIPGYLHKKRNNLSNLNEKLSQPRSMSLSKDKNSKHDQSEEKRIKLIKRYYDNNSELENNLSKNSHQLEPEEEEFNDLYDIIFQKNDRENNIQIKNLQNISNNV